MHRIDDEFSLPDANGPGRPGFTEGDPVAGRAPTRVRAEWLNAIQEELANAVEGTGGTLNQNDNSQLLAAIYRAANQDWDAFARSNWRLLNTAELHANAVACSPEGIWWTVGLGHASYGSLTGHHWRKITDPTVEGDELRGVTWSEEKGTFLAVGENGAGLRWAGGAANTAAAVGGSSLDFQAVSAGSVGGGAGCVAVGAAGDGVLWLATWTGGSSWAAEYKLSAELFAGWGFGGVAYNGDAWLVAGMGGLWLSSTGLQGSWSQVAEAGAAAFMDCGWDVFRSRWWARARRDNQDIFHFSGLEGWTSTEAPAAAWYAVNPAGVELRNVSGMVSSRAPGGDWVTHQGTVGASWRRAVVWGRGRWLIGAGGEDDTHSTPFLQTSMVVD